MGNDKNDVVILQLDRPRELRLGHKALKRFSALTGCAMSEMEQEIRSLFTEEEFRNFLEYMSRIDQKAIELYCSKEESND